MTEASIQQGEPKRSPGKFPGWITAFIVIMLLGVGLYFGGKHLLKPYLVEQAARALNRFVVHGDDVQIQDAEILGYAPIRIQFKRIRARGKNSYGIEQDAIYAETGTVTFEFSTLTRILYLFPDFDLSKYKAKIQSIEFENCDLEFEMISDSVMNFILFRPDVATLRETDNRPEQILIERMVLRDVDLKVITRIPDLLGLNFQTRNFDFSLDSVDMAMDIRKEDIKFDVGNLIGRTNFLAFDTIKILEQTPLQMNGDFVLFKLDRSRRANGETGTSLALDDFNFSAQYLTLALSGFYEVENRKKTYNLNLRSSFTKTKTTLDTFLKIIPASNADLIRRYDVSGELGLDVSFQKEDPETINPHIEILFESSNASFFPRIGVFKGDQRVRDLFMSGKFSNGEKNNFKTSYIEIDSIRARLGLPIDFSGSIRFDSIYDPQKIYLTTVFNIDTASLSDVLTMVDSIPHFESGGQVQLELSLEGLVRNLNLHDIDKLKYNGQINLYDLKFDSHINKLPIRLDQLNGGLDLVRNHIEVNRSQPITGSINNHEISMSGVIYNIAQYVVRQKEGLNPIWKSSFEIRLDNLGVNELADSVKAWFEVRRKLMGTNPLTRIKGTGLNLYYDINRLTDDVDLDLVVISRNLDLSGILNEEYPKSLQFDYFKMKMELRDGVLSLPEIAMFNPTDSIQLKFQWNSKDSEQMVLGSEVSFVTTDLAKFIAHFGANLEFGKINQGPVRANGHLTCQGVALEGEAGDSIALSIKLLDLDLFGEDPSFSVSNIRLETVLDQDQVTGHPNQRLTVDSIRFDVDGREVSGQVIVKNWEKGEFDMIVNAPGLPLATIHKYLHLITRSGSELDLALDRVQKLEGDLRFQTYLTGSLDTLDIMKSLLYASQNGEIQFQNIGFEYQWLREDRPLKFQSIKGDFLFDPSGISIDRFTGYFGHSNFLLTGNAQNILPFIFDQQPLHASVEFQSEFLDLTDVISNLTAQGDRDSVAESHYVGRSLFDLLYFADFQAKANIQKAFYMANQIETVELDNVILHGRVQDQILTMDPFKLQYANGEIFGTVRANILDTTSIPIQANFRFEEIPVQGIYSLIGAPQDQQELRMKGDLWMDGNLTDTLRGKWAFSASSEACIQRLQVNNLTVSNLDSEPSLIWDNLSGGSRFGLKTFLGINKDNWLDPDPRGILHHDSLLIRGGVCTVNNLEVQSNKAHILVFGQYSLEGPGTYLQTRILRNRNKERQEYTSLYAKDYTRSQVRPYLKYAYYSEKERLAIANEKAIDVSEVNPGYYKLHPNTGYTIFTLPRRLKFLFTRNPNKVREGQN